VYRQYTYDPYGNIISVKDGSRNIVNINSDTGFNNAYFMQDIVMIQKADYIS
jgi:hypothetical protein